MGKKTQSLREKMTNPSNWTEEEKENYKIIIETFNNFGKSIKAYSIDKEFANNTKDVISERFYIEFFFMTAILEAFFIKNEISFKELNQSVYNFVPKEFLWKTTISYQNLVIAKMIRLGFIEVVETGDEYMPNFKITTRGVEIYQEQILQNIATSSFYNYQTKNLNTKMFRLTILMLIVTICSVIVTILSIK